MSKQKPKLELLVGSWHLLEQVMAFGNPTKGGFATMSDALRGVAELNRELMTDFGIQFAVSGHYWHELIVDSAEPNVGHTAAYNKPRAIALDEWIEGAKAGTFAPVGRVIPPGFGIPGSDDGHFINPDPARRKLAHDMVVLGCRDSAKVKAARAGYGDLIYWTGPDGIRWMRLVQGDDVHLGYDLNPQLDEWKLIVGGVGGAMKAARELGFVNERVLIEGKAGGDPCYLDVFTDPHLEVRGIREINAIAGAGVASWQGEVCHSRGGGLPFAVALTIAIEGHTFDGQLHFNAGGLGAVNFSELLAVPGGTPMSKFPQYVDNDFLPGEGVAEWVEDQDRTLEVGARWAANAGRPLQVEFDARFCRYEDTIGALRKSALWTIRRFNHHANAVAA